MRIGIGAVGLPAGADFRKAGTARYAFQIVEHMAAADPQSEFHVYVAHDFPRPAEWQQPNIILHPVTKYRAHWALGGMKAKVAGYDLWFAPVYEVNRASWVPQCAMIHDLFPLTNPEWFSEPDLSRAREAIDRSCRKAKLLLANSEDTKQRILERYGGKPDRIVVTPLGPGNVEPAVPTSQVSDQDLLAAGIPSCTGLDDGQVQGSSDWRPMPPYVFTLGTLEPRKNIPMLIEAFALVKQRRPDLVLAIGGGKGWQDGPIFEQVKRLGLADSVVFLGYVKDEDLPKLFARAECFAMASLAEGFGIPVLEAMHYGATVACSDLGALREVCGDLAVYFDPSSPQSIADGLLARNQADRSRVIEQGFARAQTFTWQKTATLTLEAMKKFLAK